MQRILALVGPTAVGKTDIAIELAKRLNAEILGCDSMQLYRRMGRLTAQPTESQRAEVPHHALGCVGPTEEFNAAQYRALAREAIAQIQARGKSVLVVGGTGLYLKALTHGLCDAPPEDPRVREALVAAAQEQGSPLLHERLQVVDPHVAAKVHPNDARRVVRALEVYELTGRPLSSFWRWNEGPVAPMPIIGLDRDRSELHERINARVLRMLDDEHVLEEVRSVSQLPLSRSALQVHGLRFLQAYLRGEQSREETIRLWQQQVRQYARRQLIWFRAMPDIRWIAVANGETPQRIAERILDRCSWNAPSS